MRHLCHRLQVRRAHFGAGSAGAVFQRRLWRPGPYLSPSCLQGHHRHLCTFPHLPYLVPLVIHPQLTHTLQKVCNDNYNSISMNCNRLAVWAVQLQSCCRRSVVFSQGQSGQIFSSENFNVVVAYANCNHDPDRDRPSDFGDSNNGSCED